MSAPPASDKDPAALAARELARIQAQTKKARAVLERVQADVTQAQARLGDSQTGPLVAINQQLVLALLRSKASAEAAELAHEEKQLSGRSEMAQQALRAAQLQEANERLMLAMLNAQQLQAAAEQARWRQSELLAVVAHELRHPIAPIRNAATVLARISSPEPLLGRMQSIIERQVTHLGRLVGDLVDVAQVSTGKLRLERTMTGLAGVLDDAVAASRPAIDARHQRFLVRMSPPEMHLDGDSVRLTQVFSNLLDNASKYTPEGGEIRLWVEADNAKVVVTISDTGIGIPAEALDHIFEPFMRDVHANVFNSTGMGIGLTVVRELVEGHGGTVVASSSGSGLGSRFVVTLPLSPVLSV
jgi:signal transduction histidine kinase